MTFANPFIQAIVTFVFAAGVVFLARLIISPFALWMIDLRSLTKAIKMHEMTIKNNIEYIKKINKNDPALLIRIERAAFGGISEDGKNTVIFCVVSVINTGKTPTIAENFYLKAIKPTGEVNGFLIHIPGSINIGSQKGTDGNYRQEVYEGSDAIYNKCTDPITQGALVRGNLISFFPIEDRGKYIGVKIGCFDMYGKEYKVEAYFNGDGNDPPKYFPSINISHLNQSN